MASGENKARFHTPQTPFGMTGSFFLRWRQDAVVEILRAEDALRMTFFFITLTFE